MSDYKTIPLTRGRIALVDADDFERVNAFKWMFQDGYAARYARESGARRRISMASFILSPPDGMIADHVDGNTLDNRKHNLRPATPSQNTRNSRRTRPASGYRGVYRVRNQYQAKMFVGGRHIHVGLSYSPRVAAYLYDKAALRMYGEFAVLNFPALRTNPTPPLGAEVEAHLTECVAPSTTDNTAVFDGRPTTGAALPHEAASDKLCTEPSTIRRADRIGESNKRVACGCESRRVGPLFVNGWRGGKV